MKDDRNFKAGPVQSQGGLSVLICVFGAAWMKSSPRLVTVFPETANTRCLCLHSFCWRTREHERGYQPEGTAPSVPHGSEELITCPRQLDKCKAFFPSLPAVRLLSSYLVILLRFHFHLLPTQSSLIITGQGHWLLFTFLFMFVTAAWKDISLGPQSNTRAWHPFLFWLWAVHRGLLHCQLWPWSSTRGQACGGRGMGWAQSHWEPALRVVEGTRRGSLWVISQVTPMTSTRRKVLASSW